MIMNFDSQEYFGIEAIKSPKMDQAIKLWEELETGEGLPWVRGDIKTILFSNTIARELASLIALNADVKAGAAYGSGTAAEQLQSVLDTAFLSRFNPILERIIRLGGIMAKWNGTGLDYLDPGRFLVTETDSAGNIAAAVFLSYYQSDRRHYTRAEWHRFEDGAGSAYLITNKVFVSDTPDMLGHETTLEKTRWKDLEPETRIEGLEKPLFVYLKNPYSNTIDKTSPLGVSTFSECVEELRWLDIAMSTLGVETEESTPIMFVDEATVKFAEDRGITLPRFVQGMGMGVRPETTVNQWQPALQIASRKEGINFYLSVISYKCGFDPGYFVFNGQNIKVATATQVEATERRTINTVLTFRNLFDRPNSNGDGRVGYIHDLAYIINAMQAAGGVVSYSDFGNYEIFADFADLTSNEEENRAFDYQLAQSGYIPKWQFLVKHAGMTEEEAKQAVSDAAAELRTLAGPGLFDEE